MTGLEKLVASTLAIAETLVYLRRIQGTQLSALRVSRPSLKQYSGSDSVYFPAQSLDTF